MTQLTSSTEVKRSSPLLIAVAWLIVGIPAAWGVEQTIVKSMSLFREPPHVTAQISAPGSSSVAK